MNKEEVSELLKLDDQEIFRLIGEALAEDDFGIAPEDVLQTARDWWEANQSRLHDTILASNIYKAFRDNPSKWEDVVIVAAIADLLVPMAGVPPVAAVSVLILRRFFNRV